MQSPFQFVSSRDGQRVVDLALAVVWILFTKRHIDGFFEFHNPFLLLFIFSETLQVIIFLLRDRAVSVSQRPSAWVFGIVGTFVTLFFTPAQPTMAEWGGALIVLGVIFQVLGLYSLNRSFGIVAAVRSVKTKGMYRFVRHPMYASYILLFAGYLLANFDLNNFIVWLSAHIFMILRIQEEELLLKEDQSYREYMSRVRFRLIPFVY